jgi:hypothetical protein
MQLFLAKAAGLGGQVPPAVEEVPLAEDRVPPAAVEVPPVEEKMNPEQAAGTIRSLLNLP